ncbi:MAG: hypothetical protein Q9163_004842 [Psora crenata]
MRCVWCPLNIANLSARPITHEKLNSIKGTSSARGTCAQTWTDLRPRLSSRSRTHPNNGNFDGEEIFKGAIEKAEMSIQVVVRQQHRGHHQTLKMYVPRYHDTGICNPAIYTTVKFEEMGTRAGGPVYEFLTLKLKI